MKRIKLILGALGIALGVLAIFFVLKSDHALVSHPKGIIAHSELKLIKTNILLMLSIVIPTFILLFVVVWKYRAKRGSKYDPEHSYGALGELILWLAPAIVIAVMAVHTTKMTHQLDPYRPIASDVETLKIQVVALDWKWLFIYPEQGIATLNFVQFPEATPVRFDLAADGSPMNSFWIPELSGQIYAMAGMNTTLHIMADGPGVYTGRAAEINGKGFADMTFVVKSTSQADFKEWIEQVKQSPLQLTDQAYQELVKPSSNHPITLYSDVEKEIYHKIVMKYMSP